MTKRLYSVVAAALVVSALAGGCGRSSSGSDTSGAAAAAGKSAKDLVPESVRKTGELRMATSEGYPPMEMYKEGTQELIGVDPDLAAAIAAKLGLKAKVTNAAFDGLVPGLQASNWDIAMSSMSDTEERRAAVDFVDYFNAGGAIMVKKGNPEGIKTLEDLCGRSIVLAKGSSNLAIGQRQDAKCADKMKIIQSEDAPTGLLSIDSGRAVATIVDSPVAAMYAKETGKYDVLSEQYDAGPWGIAIDRRNTGLRDAVAKAMQELIADGGYRQILEKYGVAANAVPEVMVNTKPWK
ncbi:ABC transporter substrate-binding protein [Streptosporangium sandarakinum]|uniref:Polar amino acid transport system substrate-binding protein n=1 Tax=Streptosporangium sandarakinum TaxID=1260955 RepID=A0A852VAS8_9ACTN|nr:ABC transporter substrate-binding protein [Streptosporangium sandarakinum]NYF44343.1 polar amino acid transport system substrate-binding protein [Streptosporangium sandarakinum]